MLYWEDHQPKRLVFHTSSGAFPVFSCIKIRYFIEEYFGVHYVDALDQQLGFFMFGNVKITRDEIHYTFDDLGFLENTEGEVKWHSL